MAETRSSTDVPVHPWVERFQKNPEAELADFLAGYAQIEPYVDAERPDAARMLFGTLPKSHPARASLDQATGAWLTRTRAGGVPTLSPPAFHRWLRQVMDALRLVSLLELPRTSLALRKEWALWKSWIDRLPGSRDADARAEYLSTLAITQRLVSRQTSVTQFGLEPHWISICEQADGQLPAAYLQIGLLGLRLLPEREDMPSDRPWMRGLARWATVRRPPVEAFRQNWWTLKALYPRPPAYWRKAVDETLKQRDLKFIPVAIQEFWCADVGLDRASAGERQIKRLIEPPPLEAVQAVIARLDEPTPKIAMEVRQVISARERHAQLTGDSDFLVRSACNIGMRLLETGDAEEQSARGKLAVELARKALTWRPDNVFVWALWQDGLAAQGAHESAELVGWEAVRRFPEDAQRRSHLAMLLSRLPGRAGDAEHLLRETLQRFPKDVVVARQLAHILAARPEGRAEAEAMLEQALEWDPDDRTTHRQLEHLREAKARAPKPLPASTRENETGSAPRSPGTIGKDSEPVEAEDATLNLVLRGGRLRRIAAYHSWETEDRPVLVEELKQILAEDPNSPYARYLYHEFTGESLEPEPLTSGSFGLAFADALRRKDASRLDEIEGAFPDSAEIHNVARVFLFKDTNAAQLTIDWLGRRSLGDSRPVLALRGFLRQRLGAPPASEDSDEIVVEDLEAFLALIAANDNVRMDLIEAALAPWDFALAA